MIDDFAHNPDKIAATLDTMHAFPGRLLLMFQPHGYGPIRLMRQPLVDCFAGGMCGDDVLVMPEPVYYGGTVDRSVGSRELAADIAQRGRHAVAFADRTACGDRLIESRAPWRPHPRHGRARRFPFAVRAGSPATTRGTQ